MRSGLSITLLLAVLTGCTGSPSGSGRAPDVDEVRFQPQVFPRGVTRSNQTLTEDFLDLTFALESGQRIEGLLRYEGPIAVVMRSAELRAYDPDLQALLNRLRQEAGIDIRQVSDPRKAQIHIEAVPSRQIQRVYPGAACFIVPGETNWQDFRRKQRTQQRRWADQKTLGTTAVFLPSDSTPQDIRDCLHEELGQALGTANDIYRLPDSVFNDDNFHSILTSFDMLMLRALYTPELRSGMSLTAVAAKLPAIFHRINPKGRDLAARPRAPSSPQWKREIERAMTRSNSRGTRIVAVNAALRIAAAMQPTDHRLAVSLLTRGRLSLREHPQAAMRDFLRSYELFKGNLGINDMRTAQAALHLAVALEQTRQHESALNVATEALTPALRGENAVLTSGLYAVRSEALLGLGRAAEAQISRLDSLKWARYAFGDEDGVMAMAQAQLEEFGPNGGISREAQP